LVVAQVIVKHLAIKPIVVVVVAVKFLVLAQVIVKHLAIKPIVVVVVAVVVAIIATPGM